MDNYIVSARKYRPSTFASVVGQKALTATLKNAIATDRLAHAYLFCGGRGVGKTSCARIFAKTINCTNPTADGDPCNECESCRAFNENRSLNIIELDAASNNSVDDIRGLVDQVQVPPTEGRYRVFIIDEVHMLSAAAFNAFLKTLEEPPSYVVFILATTEKQKIIPTILSRCQIYDFNRITVSDMVDHLAYVASQEGITAERSALGLIARKADGAMRDALSIFDQVAASSRGNITYASAIANLNVLDSAYYSRLVAAFVAGDVQNALLIYKEIRDRGFDTHFFITGLAAYIRDLMVARSESTLSLLDADEDVKADMAKIAQALPLDFYFAAMSLCNEADLNYRQASSKTFLAELLLIRLCQLQSPSPTYSGSGEGQLKPFAAPAPGVAAPAAAPTATHTAGTSQTGQTSRTAAPAPAPASTPAPAYPPATSQAHATGRPQAYAQAAPPPPAPLTGPTRPTGPTGPTGPTTPSAPPAPTGSAPAPAQMRNARVLHSTRRADNAPAPAATTATATTSAHRTNRYTDQQVEAAWDSFAAARPTEHILINSMRSCRPRRTADDTYDVALENEIQTEEFRERLEPLLTHIRDAISNDNFRITLSINQSGPAPRIWNDREILAHLTSVSPEVVKLIDKFNLKLV
ncbi:MAG: DNA polymerase III subunit gamma/tau [Barnesiella sp.]|nr:DNA polymerase III subunit gamma/tau [Barnesiella sp.]